VFEGEKPVQSGAYFIGPSRLAQVIAHADRETFLSIATHRVGSHGDNLDVVMRAFSPTNFCRGFVPVHLGHLAIPLELTTRIFDTCWVLITSNGETMTGFV
jgi:hypothetical protein